MTMGVSDGVAVYLLHRDEITGLCPEKYPASYIDEQIHKGTWHCLGDQNAAVIIEFRQYPSGLREVHGIAAAGDLETIKGLIPVAEEMGRLGGCRLAAIESREGWLKALPDYELEQVRIVKEL